jgi:hypothetical protein
MIHRFPFAGSLTKTAASYVHLLKESKAVSSEENVLQDKNK